MRAVVQRVERASVSVVDPDGGRDVAGSIGPGLCVLVGVTHADDEAVARRLADKIAHLRVFDDDDGVMNRSLVDGVGEQRAEVLVVSQFTLYGDTSKGRRPSWIAAARPDHAEPLVDVVIDALRGHGLVVAAGRFRTDMRVELVNDGPVTLIVDV